MATRKNARKNNESIADKWAGQGATELSQGGFWQPQEVGDYIKGSFSGIRHNVGKFDSDVADITVIETNDEETNVGEIVTVNITAVLESKLNRGNIGKTVGIVYDGDMEGKDGNEYKMYRVFIFKPAKDDDLPF